MHHSEDTTQTHEIVLVRYADTPLRNRRRAFIRCKVPGCFRGHIDGCPITSVDHLVAIAQAGHKPDGG